MYQIIFIYIILILFLFSFLVKESIYICYFIATTCKVYLLQNMYTT